MINPLRSALFSLSLLLVMCSRTARSSNPLLLLACFFTDSNISSTSRVAANIRQLLPQMASRTELTGYFATSIGQNKDKVYGFALCRGDLRREVCGSCIRRAVNKIRNDCPNQSQTRIWYDYCYVAYSLENIIGTLDTGAGLLTQNKKTVQDPLAFNTTVNALMDRVESQAVKNERLFATGESRVSASTTLYALVQCSRDLSPASCGQCISFGRQSLAELCANKKGCWITYGYCYVRYELYRFFFPLNGSDAQAEPSTSVMTVVSSP